MSISAISFITQFPYQTRSRREKSKSFFKECVDAGSQVVFGTQAMGLRESLGEKISNYNLVNDIVDPREVHNVVNPLKIEADMTANYRNYPLINSYLNNLIGEERERLFNPLVVLTNPDLINLKLENMKSFMEEYLIQQITNEGFDEQKTKEEIQRQAQWFTFNYRDRRERMAEQVLRYGINTLRLNEEFNKNFEDLLIGGEEIAVAEIVGGEPILRKGIPLNFYTIRGGESHRFEDSDIIIEYGFISVGQAIDEYYEYLTKAEIKKLDKADSTYSGASMMFTRQLKNRDLDLSSWIDQQGGIGNIVLANKNVNSLFSGAFDNEGNVRRIKVMWKGKRKVGVLTYLDEDGDLQKKYIDEDYPLDEDEDRLVKWIWINEWYEGTRLADDIYVKMGPMDVQMRSMSNPSICYPGIVGTVFGVSGMRGKSLVSLAKPYQLMYNYFMYKLWEEMKTYKGSIAKISTATIPRGWSMDQFLYYIEQMKIAFEDPFNTGKEGAAMGKLAGSMNQSSPNMKIGDPEVIQQILLILNFIEMRLADITGISRQRKGATENRETYRGIERAVTQSTLNTAKYYYVHNDFKIRALEAYLETAKIAWKNQKFKRQFILDDGSQAVLDFDSDLFTESQYGLHITNATGDKEMMQTLKSLAQPFLQNGGSLSMVAELFRTKDPASLQRKLEAYENRIAQQRQQEEEMKIKQMEQARQEELAAEERRDIRDNDTKLKVAAIASGTKLTDIAAKTGGESMSDLDREKMDLERSKLDEESRKNQAAENLKREEMLRKPTVKK